MRYVVVVLLLPSLLASTAVTVGDDATGGVHRVAEPCGDMRLTVETDNGQQRGRKGKEQNRARESAVDEG